MQVNNNLISHIENFSMALAHSSGRNCRLYVTYKVTTETTHATREVFLVMRKVAGSGDYSFLTPLKQRQDQYLKNALTCEEKNLDNPNVSEQDRKIHGYMKLVLKIQVFENTLDNSINISDVKLTFLKKTFGSHQINLIYNKSIAEEKTEKEKFSQEEQTNILEKQKVCITVASLPINLKHEEEGKQLKPFWESLQALNWTNYALMHEMLKNQSKR